MQDVVAAAPPDWDILQLWTNNPSFYEYFQRGREEGIPPMAKEGVDTTGPVGPHPHPHPHPNPPP